MSNSCYYLLEHIQWILSMSLAALVTTGRMINTTTSTRFILSLESICCSIVCTKVCSTVCTEQFWRVGGGAPGSRVGGWGLALIRTCCLGTRSQSGEGPTSHHPGATNFASTCTLDNFVQLIKEYELSTKRNVTLVSITFFM